MSGLDSISLSHEWLVGHRSGTPPKQIRQPQSCFQILLASHLPGIMGRKLTLTQDASCGRDEGDTSGHQDASCGPDETEWKHWQQASDDSHDASWWSDTAGWQQWQWNWPWPYHKHQDVETETNHVDLQNAQENQQHLEDETYVTSYYEKRAARRKRYQEKQEGARLASWRTFGMARNDFPAGSRLGDSFKRSLQQKEVIICDTEPDTASQRHVDKTSMPPILQDASTHAADKTQPLAASILAIAATLDGEGANKKRHKENPSSGSGTQLHQQVNLNGPYWSIEQLEAPMDRIPDEPVMKSFPQPRTAGTIDWSRNWMGGTMGGYKEIKPPFGIQLIESYRACRIRWKKTDFEYDLRCMWMSFQSLKLEESKMAAAKKDESFSRSWRHVINRSCQIEHPQHVHKLAS